MNEIVLIKNGELVLKGLNRNTFEDILIKNMKKSLRDLGEFTFPASYYGLDAYPSLMMMHTKTYTSSANRKKYDQQMRVAGVYLVPKEYNDYWAN